MPIASEEVQEVPHPSEDSVQGIVGAHPVESGATSEASPNVWVGRGTGRRHLFLEACQGRGPARPEFLLILWADVGSMNVDYLGIHPTQGI